MAMSIICCLNIFLIELTIAQTIITNTFWSDDFVFDNQGLSSSRSKPGITGWNIFNENQYYFTDRGPIIIGDYKKYNGAFTTQLVFLNNNWVRMPMHNWMGRQFKCGGAASNVYITFSAAWCRNPQNDLQLKVYFSSNNNDDIETVLDLDTNINQFTVQTDQLFYEPFSTNYCDGQTINYQTYSRKLNTKTIQNYNTFDVWLYAYTAEYCTVDTNTGNQVCHDEAAAFYDIQIECRYKTQPNSSPTFAPTYPLPTQIAEDSIWYDDYQYDFLGYNGWNKYHQDGRYGIYNEPLITTNVRTYHGRFERSTHISDMNEYNYMKRTFQCNGPVNSMIGYKTTVAVCNEYNGDLTIKVNYPRWNAGQYPLEFGSRLRDGWEFQQSEDLEFLEAFGSPFYSATQLCGTDYQVNEITKTYFSGSTTSNGLTVYPNETFEFEFIMKLQRGLSPGGTPIDYDFGAVALYDIEIQCIQIPTENPTLSPTSVPTENPTFQPTNIPTTEPTNEPTIDPTIDPTSDPTQDPTFQPSQNPTTDPTNDPTIDPTIDPTTYPTTDPTIIPTIDPTNDPTNTPSQSPTNTVTLDSSEEAWLAYQSRKQQYEPMLNNMIQIYQSVIIGFISFMLFVLITAIIHAKYAQTNDYLRISAIIVMLVGTIDVISDWFFVSQVHTKNKIELKNSYEMIQVIAIMFIAVPSLLSIFQMHNYSKKHWLFRDYLRLWLSNNSVFLFALSVLIGNAFNAVYLMNSSIHGLSIFDMGLTNRELNIFGSKRMYSIVVLENIPQLFFQMYYLTSSAEVDPITASSMVFSLISIMMSMAIIKMANTAHYSKEHETICISMDITGDCIQTKSNYCTMSKNHLQQLLSELLSIDKNAFEIVKPVYTENGLSLNIYIYVDYKSQMDIDHQQILIKANHKGKLSPLFQTAWDLSNKPQINNILYSKTQTIMSSGSFSLKTGFPIPNEQPEIELVENVSQMNTNVNQEDNLDTKLVVGIDEKDEGNPNDFNNNTKEYQDEGNFYSKDTEYSQIFETKPLGLIFGKKNYFGQQDQKNLYVTGIDDIGDKNKENVTVGSKIIKLQDEYVENIGYKKIFKLFTEKYADTLPLKITFIEPNNLDADDEKVDHEKKTANDPNVYCVVFKQKPLGLALGKVKKDKKNLFVTGVDKDGVADKANVIIGSKVIQFEDEVVENLGFMQIFHIFADKYSTKIPLKMTFRDMSDVNTNDT